MSWSKEPIEARVQFDAQRIGFSPPARGREGVTNREVELTDNTLSADFEFPYDTRVFLLDGRRAEPNVLFADDFDDWCSPGWDYVSPYATFEAGQLRLGQNVAGWMGPPRVFKYLDLPDAADAELSLRFRVEHAPEGRTGVLSAALGAGVDFSRHGLTHSYLHRDVTVSLSADPKRGWVLSADSQADGKRTRLGDANSGAVDTNPHALAIRVRGASKYTVALDGRKVLSFEAPGAGRLSGLAIEAVRDPGPAIGMLEIDNVVLRAADPNRTGLAAKRAEALARSREIVSARIDELKQRIIAQYGVFGHKPIYNLAMFRQPMKDVTELTQRLSTETAAGRRDVLLAVLRELPKRQVEHVQSMTAIGQTPHRLEQFRRAREQALEFLKSWSAPKDTQPAAQETIDALSAPEPL